MCYESRIRRLSGNELSTNLTDPGDGLGGWVDPDSVHIPTGGVEICLVLRNLSAIKATLAFLLSEAEDKVELSSEVRLTVTNRSLLTVKLRQSFANVGLGFTVNVSQYKAYCFQPLNVIEISSD